MASSVIARWCPERACGALEPGGAGPECRKKSVPLATVFLLSLDLDSRACSQLYRVTEPHLFAETCMCVCAHSEMGGRRLLLPESFFMRALSSASISWCMESLETARSHSSRFVASVSIRPHLEEVLHSAHTAWPAPWVPRFTITAFGGTALTQSQILPAIRTSGGVALGAPRDPTNP